ncbi:unnamed protein product [Paramecium sonneborni]|uniref:Transmembrane protein n=1 Tax=Paramecium sonneborni TaxID=65129 RepID=A0A8S1LM42_9CILI|nr:unnamed protein product [Paramecium sonneborni]
MAMLFLMNKKLNKNQVRLLQIKNLYHESLKASLFSGLCISKNHTQMNTDRQYGLLLWLMRFIFCLQYLVMAIKVQWNSNLKSRQNVHLIFSLHFKQFQNLIIIFFPPKIE